MRQGIHKGTFSNFKFNMNTKLMEDYNISTTLNDEIMGDGSITEVCACVDNKDWEVAIVALADGSIYQFYADVTGDTDFLSRKINITGEKLAIGLCGSNKIYLFAVRDNKLYYTRETRNGSNIFEDEREADIADVIDGRTLERVIVRGLDDGLAVGLILKNSKGSYEFAVSYFEDDLADFEIEFYNQETNQFIFTGEDYNGLNIVKAGDTYVKFNISAQTADIFKNQDERKILDIQWTQWHDGINTTFVLLADKNTDLVTLAAVKEDSENKKIEFEEIMSQNGLESFLLTSYHAKRREEVHLLALGKKFLYHSLAVKNEDGSIQYNTFMPIAAKVVDASFTSDTTGKVTMYINKEGERKITQLRYNKYTADYMENTMYLPALNGDNIRKTSCYSSEIRITDPNDVPLANEPVTIWAREDVYLETPGGQYLIGKNNIATLKTDFKGCLTIKQEVRSLNANMIFLRFNNLMENGQNIEINQMAAISAKLENINSNVLINAKTASGYLLPDNVRKSAKKVNEIVNPIRVAAGLILKNMNYGSVVGACIISDAEMEEEYFCEPDGLNVISNNFYKDLWWSTREGIIPITKTYVSSLGSLIIEYVIDGINQIYEFITNTIDKFFDYVEIVFKKIGVSFQKLFEWLGFLFDWEDILRSKKAVKYLVNRQLSYFKSQTGTWSKTLCDDIEDFRRDAHEIMIDFANIISGKSFFGYYNEQKVENKDMTQALSNNFVQDKLFSKSSEIIVNDLNISVSPLYEEGMNDLIEKLEKYSSYLQSNEDIQKGLGSIRSGYSSLDRFFTNLFADFVKCLDTIIQLILTGIEELITAAFSLLEETIDAFSDLMNHKIEIPYIGSLYRYISGGDNLTFLDLVSLLIAIPLTVGYKVITKSAPFDSDAKVAQYCDAIDKKLSGNGNFINQSALPWMETIDKMIGAFSGFYLYIANMTIDSDYIVHKEGNFFDDFSIICELIYTATALPVLNGTVGKGPWALFYCSAVGFILDLIVFAGTKLYIDRFKKGAYVTTFYGVIHIGVVLYAIGQDISTIKWYDIVGNIAPCFAEIFKFMTDNPSFGKMLLATIDGIVALAVAITGVCGVFLTNGSHENANVITI